jgi:hypothetical protein
MIAAALIVIGGFLVWWLSPGQVLKRRTEKLLSALTLTEGRNKALGHMGVYSLNSMITKELELETPTEQANGTFEREQIESGFSYLGSQAEFTKFDVKDFQSVAVDGNRATVTVLIEGVVALSNYRPVDGLYQVSLDWQLEEDGWRLSKAKWVESR